MRVFVSTILILALAPQALANTSRDYRVLSDDRFEIRRVVAVELLGRLRKSKLEEIAVRLKSRDQRTYQRTIVNFYLPSMSLGSGSWATVAFKPGPETTVNGLNYDQERQFIAELRKDKRKRIGSWLTGAAPIAGNVTLFRKDGGKFVEWSLQNGLKSVEEVVESRTWRGRRFDIKTESHSYLLINHENNLEVRDAKGLVVTAEQINLDGRTRRQFSRKWTPVRLTPPTPRLVSSASSPNTEGVNHQDDHRGTAASSRTQAKPLARRHAPKTARAARARKRKVRKARRAKANASEIFMANMLR